MLSAVITSERSQPAVLLAEQLAHQRFVRPGPLVLGTALLKFPTRAADRDRHICYHNAKSSLLSVAARSFLPGSACRHAGRTISSPIRAAIGVRRGVSEDSGRCTRRYRPPPFMASADARGRANPAASRCSPACIARTMRAKVTNSCCLPLINGSVSKNGMTRVTRSCRRRTTYTSVVSRVPRWFSRIRPQPRRSRMRYRTSARDTS